MKKLEKLLLERTGALKHSELRFDKATIELQSKSAHLDNLLQENEEVRK